MKQFTKQLHHFIGFHDGVWNQIFHIIGFALMGVGLFQKNIFLFIAGAVVQELGHILQYILTRKPKDNPLLGLKSQSIFAFPLFILGILYIVLST